ncbi:putative dihydrofolate reductase [Pectobacterium phage DU_PP_V]|uniref:Putative dihydrofolate reductase n=1 Tax=Pectobacterium phage DU_PP_V TaxID=2041492 RepID=A0A2D2W6Y3_9CAUD|nr:putative dihydrofolate reductase [Pectobacterium phage DU_PP_V]ATS94057.1 putative dihydrofolate reductase [Pectobacterium phage DU_PP_V]
MYAVYAKGPRGEFGSNHGNGLPWGSYPEELERFYWGLNNFSLKIKSKEKEPILVTTEKWYESTPSSILHKIEEAAGTVKWVLVGRNQKESEEYSLGALDRHLRVSQVGKSLDMYLEGLGYTGICIGGANLLITLYSLDLISEALVSIVQSKGWSHYPHTYLTLPSSTLNSPTRILMHKVNENATNTNKFAQYREIY